MIENGFPNVAKKLTEEMNNEIEELKYQFEESRLKSIEKIKMKFVKRLK